MFNLTADLEKNLRVYQTFTRSRSSVNYPAKMDVPMVWDLYMDTTRPVGGGAEKAEDGRAEKAVGGRAEKAAGAAPADVGAHTLTAAPGTVVPETSALETAQFSQPLPDAVFPETFRFSSGGAAAAIGFTPEEFDSAAVPVTYRSPVSGDLDLLGLVNDRLKTQARRYPHPITNELEDFH